MTFIAESKPTTRTNENGIIASVRGRQCNVHDNNCLLSPDQKSNSPKFNIESKSSKKSSKVSGRTHANTTFSTPYANLGGAEGGGVLKPSFVDVPPVTGPPSVRPLCGNW